MSDRPLLSIWIHPRQTIRAIIDDDPRMYVIPLTILCGISGLFGKVLSGGWGAHSPFWAVFTVVIVGPLASLFMLWASSYLILWTGNMLRGRATLERLRAAIAWGMLPTIFKLFFWGAILLIFGAEFFAERPLQYDETRTKTLLLWMSGGILLLSLWSLIILSNAIAEVQRYRSAWLGLWNLILAGAMVVIPALMVMFTIVSAAANA